MDWFITHKPAYDADFVELSKTLQKQATQAHAELARAPATPRGNTVKPLKGWKNLWRYRMGDYRLIYSVVPDSHVVQLLAIGPRKDVYDRFKYDPKAEEMPTLTFSSELAAGLEPERRVPAWVQHPEWYQAQGQKPQANALPRKLTLELLRRWRIPETCHEALMRCRTEDELLQASDQVPDPVLNRIIEGLWPSEVEQIARQPDQVLFNPEDLERYAEGTLSGFLLHLDEAQRRFVDWGLSGPTLVKGGPGSGKSTIALYRVRTLIEHALGQRRPIPQVLFTTYTNALINCSQSLLCQLLGDVLDLKNGKLPWAIRVTTVDKIVMSIVRKSGRTFDVASRKQSFEALHYARSALKPRAMGDLEKLLVSGALQNLRDRYLLKEFDWVIEGQNCRELDAYLKANRAGRGIPFDDSVRSAVWQLYVTYRDALEQQSLCTWGQLRQLALEQVQTGAFPRRWDYVIVDEAQDLPPVALALCVELCRTPAGIFLTADANQSLYNRGFRWRQVHEQLQVVGRTRLLRRNYRNTRQIVQAAAELLTDVDSVDAEAMGQEIVHVGQVPVIYAADGASDQARWLAHKIWRAAKELRLPLNAAAVLVPTNSLGKSVARLLEGQGLPARFMPSNQVHLEEPGVKVMTLYAAKGLEFPIVAVAHVEADRLPRETAARDAQEIQEHLDGQRRLFYVGCSRAMRYLFVTYDRSLPSPFLKPLSDKHWFRIEQP